MLRVLKFQGGFRYKTQPIKYDSTKASSIVEQFRIDNIPESVLNYAGANQDTICCYRPFLINDDDGICHMVYFVQEGVTCFLWGEEIKDIWKIYAPTTDVAINMYLLHNQHMELTVEEVAETDLEQRVQKLGPIGYLEI